RVSFLYFFYTKKMLVKFTNIKKYRAIKDTRDLSCIFFILSGFVRYTRKPKDNKNFILAESGFR
ncbi:hypothetical protein, partial [Enterococcus faecium]|uniref:hypothetical protein n=1 Tax=Enterococcus faecium TaxID=1352 RepID=UPI002891E265